jgi:hypothetical protein
MHQSPHPFLRHHQA